MSNIDVIERILHGLYPDREDFSDSEVEFIGRVLDEERDAVSSKTRVTRPSVYCDVGGVVRVGGHVYSCIERPDVHWCDACSGCDFSVKYRTCDTVQCSRFERRDGRFVWFREVENEEREG